MTFRKDKIILTGGCGYIGSHTAVILLELGYDIVIIDSNINSSSKVLSRINKIVFNNEEVLNNRISFYKGDIRDESFLNSIFSKEISKGNKINSVIHFAGLKAVGDSNLFPLEYWDSNVVGTLTLIKVMIRYNCKSLIFSSSATVYKAASSKRICEKDIVDPSNPYGNTKITIEKLLKDIFDSDPMFWDIACLRYFNPIGAHPTGLLGESPFGKPNNIFPTIMNVAIGQLEKLTVFGKDWDTADGTCIRDYIHVMDVALGHIKTLQYLLNSRPQFLNLNIGTGKGTSVLKLIKTFEDTNNVNIPYQFSDRRKGDLKEVVADNSLAFSILNWKPQYSIEEMCRDGWNWKKTNPKGY